MSTPAKRANARFDPAVLLPPAPPRKAAQRDLRDWHMMVRGKPFLIGPSITGDPVCELTTDGTSTITVDVADLDNALLSVLQSEAMLLADGVTVNLDGYTYVLATVDPSDDHVRTLMFVDWVSWRLGLFTRYHTARRSKSTAAEFVLSLTRRASTKAQPINVFIPELTDKQPIAAAKVDTSKAGTASTGGGLGSSKVTVKGTKATRRQRDVINGCLSEAATLGASRLVMVCVVMAITQESEAGRLKNIFQQDSGWGTSGKLNDPAATTKAFLETGPTAWKKVHGSLKRAPGGPTAAISDVQHPRADLRNAYSQWEKEATETVKTWLGGDGSTTITKAVAYRFEAGSKDGAAINWWTSIGTIAQDRDWLRWASQNTLFYVSEPELRAAAASVVIHGDEGYIVDEPQWSWGANRDVGEVTFSVLSHRWGVLPGAVVELASQGALDGRYLVTSCRDHLLTPETEITLQRPIPPKAEPAHDTTSETVSTGKGATGLLAECEHISDQNRAYFYSGGHSVPLDKIKPSDPLDCSSSCSLALKRAGMFDGDYAIVSGAFASSWGQPGEGKDFTVHASLTHVWISFASGEVKRFDTSPWGSGGLGPHTRTTTRNDAYRFHSRHWPGN